MGVVSKNVKSVIKVGGLFSASYRALILILFNAMQVIKGKGSKKKKKTNPESNYTLTIFKSRWQEHSMICKSLIRGLVTLYSYL